MKTRNAPVAAFSLALFAFATPALAADSKRAGTPEVTQQDLNDLATALSIGGSRG